MATTYYQTKVIFTAVFSEPLAAKHKDQNAAQFGGSLYGVRV